MGRPVHEPFFAADFIIGLPFYRNSAMIGGMKIAATLIAAIPALSLSLAEEPAKLVDTLDQTNLQESFRILLADYIQPSQLSPLEINRAALDGLLDRLGLGAELIARHTETPAESARFETHHEILDGNIAYLRPAAFTEADIEKIDAGIASFINSKCPTLILDLRVPMMDADFGSATRFIERFCPANTVIFKISKPGGEKARGFNSRPSSINWTGETILLVDQDTGGAAEISAAVIQTFRDALVAGVRTAGSTVQYQTINISETAALRFAVAEAVLPDDTSLFQKGITPSILTHTPRVKKLSVFAASGKEGTAKFVADVERPTLNEAALVAGTNPELPYLIDKTAGRPSSLDEIPLQDSALQRVLDFLKVRSFLTE